MKFSYCYNEWFQYSQEPFFHFRQHQNIISVSRTWKSVNFVKIIITSDIYQRHCVKYTVIHVFPCAKTESQILKLQKKWSFPLRISSVNMTKSAGICGFGHIYWRNPGWKISFFVQCILRWVIVVIIKFTEQKITKKFNVLKIQFRSFLFFYFLFFVFFGDLIKTLYTAPNN